MCTSPRDSPSTLMPPFVPDTDSVPAVAATLNSRTSQNDERSEFEFDCSLRHQSSPPRCCSAAAPNPIGAANSADNTSAPTRPCSPTNLFIAYHLGTFDERAALRVGGAAWPNP